MTPPLEFVTETKFLGIWIDDELNWKAHLNKVLLKIQRNSHMLFRTKNMLNNQTKKCFTMPKFIVISPTELLYGDRCSVTME